MSPPGVTGAAFNGPEKVPEKAINPHAAQKAFSRFLRLVATDRNMVKISLTLHAVYYSRTVSEFQRKIRRITNYLIEVKPFLALSR